MMIMTFSLEPASVDACWVMNKKRTGSLFGCCCEIVNEVVEEKCFIFPYRSVYNLQFMRLDK